jgi:hypothetical protein
MKVAVNKQYGGFNPSEELAELYQKKKGNQLFFYHQTEYRHRDGKDVFTRVDPNDKQIHITYASITDLGKTDDGKKLFADENYFYPSDIERNDPILIECIEELGIEKASGAHCTLEIVEIPDDVSWHVEEYDGMEHIAEDHRTW